MQSQATLSKGLMESSISGFVEWDSTHFCPFLSQENLALYELTSDGFNLLSRKCQYRARWEFTLSPLRAGWRCLGCTDTHTKPSRPALQQAGPLPWGQLLPRSTFGWQGQIAAKPWVHLKVSLQGVCSSTSGSDHQAHRRDALADAYKVGSVLTRFIRPGSGLTLQE